MPFRINFHVAQRISEVTIDRMIYEYPKRYDTPRYMLFIQTMLSYGWDVKLHTVEVSKYVFVYRDNLLFKIRFSNHKPSYSRQYKKDSDFYVGISHKGKALLTKDVVKIITKKWDKQIAKTTTLAE